MELCNSIITYSMGLLILFWAIYRIFFFSCSKLTVFRGEESACRMFSIGAAILSSLYLCREVAILEFFIFYMAVLGYFTYLIVIVKCAYVVAEKILKGKVPLLDILDRFKYYILISATQIVTTRLYSNELMLIAMTLLKVYAFVDVYRELSERLSNVLRTLDTRPLILLYAWSITFILDYMVPFLDIAEPLLFLIIVIVIVTLH